MWETRRSRGALMFLLVLLALLAQVTSAPIALGAPASPSAEPAPDAATERGRQAFTRGLQLARTEQWGEALAAFEEAAAARDAPLVQFNIAFCERALGHYIAARHTLRAVLANTGSVGGHAQPGGLSASQIGDAKAYAGEAEKLIVRLTVTLKPPNATLSVDGRSLAPDEGSPGTYVATVGGGGVAASLEKPTFALLVDPGLHVFQAARSGHQDVVLRRSYRPGEEAKLDLVLDELPATVAIQSDPGSAIVHIDGREVGLAPIEFERRAGSYKLEVTLRGYDSYKAALDLQSGQRLDLTTKLNAYRQPLTKKWWFWTGAVAVVAGGAVLTYFLARPAAQPPPYDGGSTNWVGHADSLRW
jgi:hypothetical protein